MDSKRGGIKDNRITNRAMLNCATRSNGALSSTLARDVNGMNHAACRLITYFSVGHILNDRSVRKTYFGVDSLGESNLSKWTAYDILIKRGTLFKGLERTMMNAPALQVRMR